MMNFRLQLLISDAKVGSLVPLHPSAPRFFKECFDSFFAKEQNEGNSGNIYKIKKFNAAKKIIPMYITMYVNSWYYVSHTIFYILYDVYSLTHEELHIIYLITFV